MRTWTTIGAVLGYMAGLAVACNGSGGQVGAPCESNDDCQGGLICDEHDGQASCQEPHDHGDEGSGSSTGAANGSETGAPGDTSMETAAPGDSGSSTGHAQDSGSSTGHAHDGDSTTGGGAAECGAFCACMVANCSRYEAYPHADESACLEACDALEPEVFACFAGFCADAEVEPSPGLAEHWCEHAWGELGTEEC